MAIFIPHQDPKDGDLNALRDFIENQEHGDVVDPYSSFYRKLRSFVDKYDDGFERQQTSLTADTLGNSDKAEARAFFLCEEKACLPRIVSTQRIMRPVVSASISNLPIDRSTISAGERPTPRTGPMRQK